MSTFKEFRLTEAYHVAAYVRDVIFVTDSEHSLVDINDLFYPNNDFIDNCLSPQGITFLHDVIETSYNLSLEEMEHQLGWESETELINILENHEVNHLTKEQWLEKNKDEDDYTKYLLEMVIDEVTPRVVNEVFTLLFSDRALLLELGKVISQTIQPLKAGDHPKLLAMDGKVRRCTYWPAWVRKALMFRDKGHCAICLCDVSGRFAVGDGYHVDHIVPLNLGGTNDITNLQILCDTCNLEKGGDKIVTSSKYMLYW